MASARTLAWVERLTWIFLYVGLFAVALGIASLKVHAAAAWSLIIVGSLLAIAGAVLVWVRSRLSLDS
jgi:hypothetical protein